MKFSTKLTKASLVSLAFSSTSINAQNDLNLPNLDLTGLATTSTCQVGNCMICEPTDTTVCNTCMPPHATQEDGTCQMSVLVCQGNCRDCLALDPSVCLGCEDGFIMDDNLGCVEEPETPTPETPTPTPLQCERGYAPNTFETACEKINCRVNNCKLCRSAIYCLECEAGFLFDFGFCVHSTDDEVVIIPETPTPIPTPTQEVEVVTTVTLTPAEMFEPENTTQNRTEDENTNGEGLDDDNSPDYQGRSDVEQPNLSCKPTVGVTMTLGMAVLAAIN